MTTGESEFISDSHPVRVASSEVAEVSADLWDNLTCPLRGPRFPFGNATKDVFRLYFRSRLNADQRMFDSHFEGSDNERLHAEKSLREHLPEVVARDAWREALRSWTDDSYWPLILSGILCIVTPWLVASYSWWYNILAMLTGAAGAVALVVFLLYVVMSPLENGRMDSDTGILIIAALFVGATAWLYEQRPIGWLFLSTAVAASALLFATIFVQGIASELAILILHRIKIVRHFHAELSDTFLGILASLSKEPAENAEAASSAYYVAGLIEHHWQQRLPGQTSDPAIQQRVRTAIRGIAAGMREIGVNLAFPTKIANSEESFESKMVRIMAKQLTALTTFRYGDLIVVDAPEVAIRPRFWRILRSIRSVIAAIAPITLLLIIPRAFNFTINENLNGTLLTVSLGWLALYIIGWLDPKGLDNFTKLPDITNIISTSKK